MLLQANVAVPIVFGTINGIAAIIKGVTGSGPTLSEIADILEDKVEDKNDPAIKAEIARMKALLGA